MATLSDLARRHTTLGAAGRAHLRRLVGSWSPLADLGFADLLVCAPAAGAKSDQVVVLGQIRPTTAPTLFVEDLIGTVVDQSRLQGFQSAYESGRIVELESLVEPDGRRATILAVPVNHEGRRIAVVLAYRRVRDSYAPSELEQAYYTAFRRLARMIVGGTFPFPFEGAITEETPRVGDGTMVLDRDSRVDFSSPNAISAVHRIGYNGRIVGRKVEDLGFDGDVVAGAYRLRVPVIDEIRRSESVTILARILPLLEHSQVTGALVLIRDVSELRRRDRLLVSMDTTIREIHHRVKNNLQTVSSLLRIQSRRLESEEAKEAIEEAVRRIAAIAVVHERLAAGGGDQVVFREVVQPIVEMARTTMVSSDSRIEFRLVGEGTALPASKASSLAVVVTELLQNAVEHGFPSGTGPGAITVELAPSSTDLVVRVYDNGVGVDEDFDVAEHGGLGLTIIATIITGELEGDLQIFPARGKGGGTVAQVTVRTVEEQ